MKTELIILILLILPLASAQQDYAGSPEVIEQPEPETETAVCGDGICQPEIQGVCPQDCVEGYNESENSNVQSSNPEQTSSNFTSIEILSGVLTIISGLLLSALLLKKHYSGEENSENRNRDLERKIRKRLRQGENIDSVRNAMQRKGLSQQDIQNAEKYIGDNLLNN